MIIVLNLQLIQQLYSIIIIKNIFICWKIRGKFVSYRMAIYFEYENKILCLFKPV